MLAIEIEKAKRLTSTPSAFSGYGSPGKHTWASFQTLNPVDFSQITYKRVVKMCLHD